MSTILIVGKDGVNAGSLRERGYDVLTAVSLAEARTRLEKEYPDLILLDVCQPDGSGIAFCGELRGQSEAPVLFISDRSDKKRIVESLKSGDGCVTRPFDGDELAARVTAMLRRSGMNRYGSVKQSGGNVK